jgi:ABC-type transport system involved in multi-copper enzyme maturation permease subunit
MTAAVTNLLSRLAGISRLAGPIFDKELRVCSRRRRSYALRSGYVLLLTVLTASAWLSTVVIGGGSASYTISRMGELGKNLILAITWFQFFAAQLIAVVMLSNSISDEIRRGTLDILMTTPINSFQVVAGKIFSSLLQLTLLLAISLPLLAILRVFGGMQWSYVVSSLSITFTAALFVGSVTLFLSIRFRRPYSVILIMLILLVIVHSIGSLLVAPFGAANNFVARAVVLINPTAAMLQVTYSTFPDARVAAGSSSWSLHCLIMICASVLVLLASALMIRRSALTQLYHAQPERALPLLKRMVGLTWSGKAGAAAAAIRPVQGPVIIWKELGKPISASVRSHTIIFLLLSAALVLMCCLSRGAMMVYSIFTMGLWMIASARTIAMAATSIAGEKEARTWPILLGTTLDDWQIIRGKAVAVLWRNLPLWLAMIVSFIAFFILMNLSSRGGAPGGPSFYWLYTLVWLIMLGTHVVFLIGVGMYFSVRLRSATAAVISSIGTVLGVFIFQRFFLTLIVRVLTVSIGSPYAGVILFYLVPSLIYVGAGLLLIWRAKCRLRKDIF